VRFQLAVERNPEAIAAAEFTVSSLLNDYLDWPYLGFETESKNLIKSTHQDKS